uniref:Dockerin domain-containing protein n=1 Tax=Candidatus Methanogaster sp. ANME-2c ERB4 TaxID=2759911 RepID=A0A7G9YLF6_9EURY|nr:hypothetical protein EBOGGPCF_00008 [Methanosarcinales archaeon ANME-2c ERB4]QNO46085.1 hypothetical protein FAKCHJAF_00022 [Methanosarcinales archaeon ANME-2c ERB4]QNO48840.1 hypothetical protein LEJCPHKL_00009 [Methanosarcinales archaeon ANME-2c ERB4]
MNLPKHTVGVNVTFEGHFGGVTYAVTVSGSYAYIGQGTDFVVLGISSPASPIELGRVMTSDMVYDVALSGDYAYVADNHNGLMILRVDASDAPQKGDLNHDNEITPADAAIALRLAATGAHDDTTDVSGDGRVTSLDALMILKAAAGAISLWGGCSRQAYGWNDAHLCIKHNMYDVRKT